MNYGERVRNGLSFLGFLSGEVARDYEAGEIERVEWSP